MLIVKMYDMLKKEKKNEKNKKNQHYNSTTQKSLDICGVFSVLFFLCFFFFI